MGRCPPTPSRDRPSARLTGSAPSPRATGPHWPCRGSTAERPFILGTPHNRNFLRRLVSGCTFASCVFYPARPRCQLCWIFKGFCLFIPRERGGREKERERNIDQLPLVCAPTGDRTRNPGVCPDRESNLGAFGLMDDTHPTEPRRSGLLCVCWWILKPLGADGLGPPPPTCPRI